MADNGRGYGRLLLIITLAIGIFILYYSTFVWLVQSWMTNPFYSHGFLVPVISGFFLWRACTGTVDDQGETHQENSHIWWILVFGGIALYLAGILTASGVLSSISLIVLLAGIFYGLLGPRIGRRCVVPLLFLVFAIPFPGINSFATTLAAFSATATTYLLQFAGFPVTSNGADIILPGVSLSIGIPCSGLMVLISLLLMVSILVYIIDCSLKRKVLVFFMAIPLAFAANSARITLIVTMAYYFEEEVALGFFHTAYGLFIPLVSFLCLLMIIYLTGCLKFRI